MLISNDRVFLQILNRMIKSFGWHKIERQKRLIIRPMASWNRSLKAYPYIP